MFPDCKDYLGVYEDAGLLGPRSILAHSIFTTDDEYKRMASTGTSVIHCPDSNIQLMSGIFNGQRVESFGVNIGLGTDVGASGMDGIVQQIRMAEMISKNQVNPLTQRLHVKMWMTTGKAGLSKDLVILFR